MKNLCKIYYGISGTFKGTTISQKRGPEDLVLWSGIKPWKYYEKEIFGELGKERDDLNYAILHYCEIEQLLKNISLQENNTFFIERGVTDMDFYHIKNKGFFEHYKTNDEWIKKSVREELGLLKNFEIEKILLIQKDNDFISNVIFSEPTRAKEFTGLEDYLKRQEEYINFTKTYNQIDQEITIYKAEDYIKSLGLNYKEINNKSN